MKPLLHCGLAAVAAFSIRLSAQGSDAPVFDPDLGIDQNLSDDQTVVVSLPFSYVYSGAAATTQISICSNGFVFLGADTNASYTPSAAALQSGTARIAALWLDLNPAQRPTSQSGVYFRAQTSPANRAVITWHKVPIFGTTRLVTVQLQLLGDGSYAVHYDAGVFPDRPAVVGSSPGGGAPLQAVDLSMTERRHIAVSGASTLHESFATGVAFDLNGRDLLFSPGGGNARLAARRQAESLVVADHTSLPPISGPGWYDKGRQTVVFDGLEFEGRWYRPSGSIRQSHNADAVVVGVADHNFDGDGLFATWSAAAQSLEFWRRTRGRWQALGPLLANGSPEVAMASVPFGDLVVIAPNTTSPVQVYAYVSSPNPRMVLSPTPFAPVAGIARSVCEPPSAFPYPHLIMLVQTASGTQHWELQNGFGSLEWRQRAISTPPSAMPMALDVARNRVVCSNGATSFEFNGTSWTQVAVASPPAARTGHTLVYDEARQHV